MKRFIQSIKNIWKVEDLRNRILLTLGLILVYRVGSFVVLPGVNYDALVQSSSDQNNTLENLLSLFSGGGFTNASIMALGIMPYISASIIMQLLGMAVPAVQKNAKRGRIWKETNQQLHASTDHCYLCFASPELLKFILKRERSNTC
jgi:preprotein translocase subunit SecY